MIAAISMNLLSLALPAYPTPAERNRVGDIAGDLEVVRAIYQLIDLHIGPRRGVSRCLRPGCRAFHSRRRNQMAAAAAPVAALGLGWIGLVIVILIIVFLITRIF
jgi:hypothetical protein